MKRTLRDCPCPISAMGLLRYQTETNLRYIYTERQRQTEGYRCKFCQTLINTHQYQPISMWKRGHSKDTSTFLEIKINHQLTSNPTFTKQAKCLEMFLFFSFGERFFLISHGLSLPTSHHFLIVLGDLLSGRHVLQKCTIFFHSPLCQCACLSLQQFILKHPHPPTYTNYPVERAFLWLLLECFISYESFTKVLYYDVTWSHYEANIPNGIMVNHIRLEIKIWHCVGRKPVTIFKGKKKPFKQFSI